MKLIALAAALTLGSAAVAQTTPQGTTMPQTGGTMTPQTGTPMTPQPGMPPMTDTPAPTDMGPTTTTPTDPMSTTTPGTPPMSTPMPMTTGTPSGGVTFAPPSTTPAPQSQGSYPVCSRTVTDQCRNPGGR